MQIPHVTHPTAQHMEHRWGQRVAIDQPVYLETDSRRATPGRMRDASISGGFIETTAELPLHANLSVVVLIGSSDARRAVELPACVTRVARSGVGVEWRDMASAPLLALLRAAGNELAHLTRRDRAFN